VKIAASFLAIALASCLAWAGPALYFPLLSGRVVDQADVMTAASRSEIETKSKDLEEKSGVPHAVATVVSLQGSDIETYANELFRYRELGVAKKNNGVLFLIAPAEHEARIEVGYGLEDTPTDALSSIIISSIVVPRFKTNGFSGGIERGVDSIVSMLNGDTAEWQAKVTLGAGDIGDSDLPALFMFVFIVALLVVAVWQKARSGHYVVHHGCKIYVQSRSSSSVSSSSSLRGGSSSSISDFLRRRLLGWRRSIGDLAVTRSSSRRLFTGLILCLVPTVAFAFDFPPLSGRVVDQAGVISPASKSDVETKSKDLEDKSGIQLVVATVKSLQGGDVETYANQLFRFWKLGEAKKNNGVLLLVAPAEHKVRIEVGYGLEGTLTDALASVIISSAIVPRFKANDYSGGIQRGVDGIIAVLTSDADEWHRKANVRADDPSGDLNSLFPILFLVFLIFFIWYLIHQANGPGSGLGGTGGRRHPVIVPPLGGSWGSGWDGGGFSGGGGFGGGFSGGGGWSGGGGASGSW
jgi:uncharacterized protein